jgi:hypothetical protein
MPFAVITVSAIISYFLTKKFPINEKFSVPALFFSFIMLLLVAYPLLFIHPYFPASSDVLHVTNVRILNDKIPFTYAPYSDIRFTYQIGFALLSNAFTEVFAFIPDYLIIWFLGALFSASIILLVYAYVKETSKSEQAALLSVVLVFGSKFVFQNFYYGVFPFVTSFATMFATLLFLEKKNPLAFLFFPTTLILHPFTGTILAFFLLLKFFFCPDKKFNFFALLSGLIAFPAFLRTYAVVFSNAPSQLLHFNINESIRVISTLPFWLGPLPLLFFILSAIFSIKKNWKNLLFIYSILLFIGFILFSGLGLQHNDKFFILFSIFAVIYSGFFFSTSEWNTFYKSYLKKIPFLAIIFLIFAFSLATFFLSGDLANARSGSKATVQEFQFAKKFYEFDPQLSTAVILSKGAGWIAAISNKIPYDVRSNHFIPDSEIQVAPGDAWNEVVKRNSMQKKIQEGCIKCITETNSKYLVVNRAQYDLALPYKPLFEYNDFSVFLISDLNSQT